MWSLVWQLTKWVHQRASDAYWDVTSWTLDLVGIDLSKIDFGDGGGFGGGGGDGGG